MIVNLKDEIWRSLRKEEERRLSMITRTDLDDHTGMDVLNFVAGQEITSIAKNRNLYNEIEELILYFKSGNRLHIYHDYDCCEDVILIDIVGGNIDDLVGQQIISMKSVYRESDERLFGSDETYLDESNTWTFVTISTFKDDITLRWHGGSNGYYSEHVDFAYYDEDNKRLY